MLGSLEVRAGPGDVLEVGGSRLRALLIMLALRPPGQRGSVGRRPARPAAGSRRNVYGGRTGRAARLRPRGPPGRPERPRGPRPRRKLRLGPRPACWGACWPPIRPCRRSPPAGSSGPPSWPAGFPRWTTLDLAREPDISQQIHAVAATALGYVAGAEGDLDAARAWHAEALAAARSTADAPVLAEALAGLADLALGEGDPERSAQLLGASLGSGEPWTVRP